MAMPLGVWLAMLITKTNARGGRWAMGALMALIFLPLYLQAASWQAAFGMLGWWTLGWANSGGWAATPIDPLLAGWAGVAWVHGLAATPWVALVVCAALRAIDRHQEESALVDASPPRVLARITLRHAAAGAAVAALWVAVLVAAEMTVTDLLQVRTFAEEIYTQAALGLFSGVSLDLRGQSPALSAMSLVVGSLLLSLLGMFALAIARRWMIADKPPADADVGEDATGDPAKGEGHWRWRLRTGGGKTLAMLALWLPMTLLLVAPVFNLAYQAGVTAERQGDAWQRGWSATKVMSAVLAAPMQNSRELWVTAQLAAAVALGAVLLGGIVAWRMSRARRTPWLALAAIAIGLVIPGPVLGIGAIRLLNHPWDSPLAGLTWLYDNTLFAAWLVQMVRATPIAALILWPAFASVPESLLATARTFGVGFWGQLPRIVAPMRWRSIVAAMLASAAISVGELAATILVLPPGPPTVTVRIFSLLHYGVEHRVAGICLSMIAFFLVVAGLAAWLLGKKKP